MFGCKERSIPPADVIIVHHISAKQDQAKVTVDTLANILTLTTIITTIKAIYIGYNQPPGRGQILSMILVRKGGGATQNL